MKNLKKKDLIVKVPLAQIGKWWNPKFGLISFSLDHFNTIIKNFKANILGHPPYLTYGHLDEEHDSIDSQRKRGDLIDLRVVDKTLFGYFKVKPLTYRFVKDGEYEFSSVEYLREGYNKETKENVGTLLQRVALTNSPFVPFGSNKAIALSNNIKAEGNRFCVSSTVEIENLLHSQYNSNNNNNLKFSKMKISPNSDQLNEITVDALETTITNRVTKSAKYDLEQKELVIAELKAKAEALEVKLQEANSIARKRAKQLVETQTNMGRSIQNNFAATLLSQGIAKPTVDKCILLLDAHNKSSNTVSLSDNEGNISTVGIPQLLTQIVEEIKNNETIDLSVQGSLSDVSSDYGHFNGGYIDQEIARLSTNKA
jgi:hypothetical protein